MAKLAEIKIYLYRGRSAWLENLLCYKIRRKVAESWEELPKKAALAYAALIYARKDEIYTQVDGKYVLASLPLFNMGRAAVLYYMLGLWRWIWKALHKELIHSLLNEFQVTDFLFASYPTRNFIPFIRCRKFGKLYGPENFDCLRGNEFAFADEMYLDYRRGDLKALDKLIAVLYRKGKVHFNPESFDSDGDRREPFNMHTVDARLPAVEKLLLAEKAIISMWYAGCRQQWTALFPNVFPVAQDKNDADALAGAGWLDTLRKLSGSKFGDMDHTLRFNMYLILCEAEDLIKQAKLAKKNKENGGF